MNNEQLQALRNIIDYVNDILYKFPEKDNFYLRYNVEIVKQYLDLKSKR